MTSERDDGEAQTSVLSLTWRVREGTPPDELGSYATRREFLDFVIDGKSLFDMLALNDWVGFMADWPNPPSISELLPEGSSQLEEAGEGRGRRLLYVCPECGDVFCGAVTGMIVEDAARIVWKDFATLHWEWDEERQAIFDTEQFQHIGPFYFDREQYVDALRNPPLRPVP